jgi:hypothetical protein
MNAAILLGQAGLAGTVGYWGVILLIVAGVVGIVYVIARAVGVEIPGWLIQCGWIVVAVCVGVVAIKLIIGLI